jgi:hypothetical protein
MGRRELDPAVVARRMESSSRVYTTFNHGDIEAMVALLCPDVDWANPLEGGRGRGHDAIRSTWERVSKQFACKVAPLKIEIDARGRVVIDAEVAIRDAGGKPLAHQQMGQVFTFRDDLIERLDVFEPPGP